MPVEVVEKFESRLVTTGTNPSVELRYTIRGTDDDVEARGALVANSPALYDPWGGGLLFLPRDTVSVQPVGEMLWEGIVRYGTIPATNESVFSFDTGGGTRVAWASCPRKHHATVAWASSPANCERRPPTALASGTHSPWTHNPHRP